MTAFEVKRKAAGLTQKQVAEGLGISEASVRQWERGKIAPAARHYPALAELLGIPADDVVRLFEQPAQSASA